MAIVKSKLIKQFKKSYPNFLTRDITKLIDIVLKEIKNSLNRGESVELRGFGAFSVQHRKQRIGRNPRTGESVNVDEKFIPRFKTGKELRLKLNNKVGSEPEQGNN